MAAPSASYAIILRVRMDHDTTALGRVTTAVGEAGGAVTGVDIVESHPDGMTADITANAGDVEHANTIRDAVNAVDGATVHKISDRTFLIHLGGKMEIRSKVGLRTRDDLSRAYTPGVARVCMAIHDKPEDAWRLTIKRNTVAVVTDGSAVLGLGNIGPEAAMPVMEGKAVLFKEFGGVDAWPVCLATQDPDEIVKVVQALAPTYGGINLEDIAAPGCFEIERRLRETLDIPVFHDDQHGTAIVTLAALTNALRVVGKRLGDVRITMTGAGAAGVAILKILQDAGATNIVICDRDGAIHKGVPEVDDSKQWLQANTNPEQRSGSVSEVIAGSDVFIGVSGPGVLTEDDVASMADDAIVFAMANPEPEIDPAIAARHARVVATGRSDYPNQINNVLAFPGVFRGALNAKARDITEEMKVAAAHAIANVVSADELHANYIVPSVFNAEVAPAVAAAVERVAANDAS
ncbi:NADP-dependent malic enzyme [Euzebya pacifica]|uniref:NADP-dependent malic enzyme n=1 Tax=Euzebya pacifica TaxID=1608957 RepID=A0A346XUT1_9ACTN|nr:NAD-dependent malic enzyme [Euzebya pacifica]AXV05978.1 NADP-dependent malic enzyme [Euzebya pacifica]